MEGGERKQVKREKLKGGRKQGGTEEVYDQEGQKTKEERREEGRTEEEYDQKGEKTKEGRREEGGRRRVAEGGKLKTGGENKSLQLKSLISSSD